MNFYKQLNIITMEEIVLFCNVTVVQCSVSYDDQFFSYNFRLCYALQIVHQIVAMYRIRRSIHTCTHCALSLIALPAS